MSSEEHVTARDARALLRESRALLRRGRGKVGESEREVVERAQETIRELLPDGPSDELDAAAEELAVAIDEHLAFARKSRLREYLESASFAILFALVLRAFVVEAFQIPSASMVPTLLVGDHLFVAKYAYGLRVPFTTDYLTQWDQPERGDVVVFAFPREEVWTQVRIGRLTELLRSQRGASGWPESLDVLIDPATGAALPEEELADGWGRPFEYEARGDSISLRSAGPDGELGTGDDLDQRNSAFVDGVRRCLDWASLVERKDYIKRVVGLPGDRVAMRDNVVLLNGEPLERVSLSEPLTTRGLFQVRRARDRMPNGREFSVQFDGTSPNFDEIMVRPDHVFVMGDNRDDSSDGRCWGQVPIDHVKGNALFIFYSSYEPGLFRGMRWERLFQAVE